MATMQEEIQKYKAQTQQYDAGRPNTMSADKLGTRVVPAGGQRFDPSYDSKSLSAGRTSMPASAVAKPVMPAQAPRNPIQMSSQPVNNGGEALMDKMQQNFTRFSGNFEKGTDLKAAAGNAFRADRSIIPSRLGGGYDETTWRDQTAGSTVGQAPQPAQEDMKVMRIGGDDKQDAVGGNAFSGNYAASDAKGQGIFKDPATGRTSIRLTGEEGGKFMNERIPTARPGMTLSATEAKDGKSANRPMGEYGGMYAPTRPAIPVAQAAPTVQTQQGPVAYQRNVVNAAGPAGMPAEETWTPQPQAAPTRAAMPTMSGNPIVDQRNMESALARRQGEIIQAERSTPGLLYAPGSRDYISPALSEADQRAAQITNDAQRRQDMNDARDNTIAQMNARDAGLAYAGVPTDATRNQSMAPYAARRTDINTRDAMLTRAQEQEKTGAALADNEATRVADMAKAQATDATTRRGQDVDQETNRINSEIAAQSKALDRQNALDAAMLKIENTADPVLLKKVDGYNEWLKSIMSMGQTPTAEQLVEARTQYGVASLFPGPANSQRVPAPAAR